MYAAVKLAVTTLVLPPGGPVLLVVVGVLYLRRCPRVGRALALAGVAALWLLSLPIVAGGLVNVVGGARPLDMAEASAADAIVILGGGVRRQAVEYEGDTLGRLTLERVRYGAYLARRTGLPVLVTGGAPHEDVRAEADLMREALETEYGVSVRWSEPRSRNTRENASYSAQLLVPEGKRRVVLVTNGFDVRRARRMFESSGLEVVAAPTSLSGWNGLEVADLLPSASALSSSHFALYEFLALARDLLFERAESPRGA